MRTGLFAASLAALFLIAACTTQTMTGATVSLADNKPKATTVDVTARLNAERKAKGLSRLKRSAKLEAAARAHVRDMAARGYFSHTSANGDSLGDRVRAKGYKYCRIAENIAKGQPNKKVVMNGWMRSRGHRRNILDRKMRQYGMARSRDYWVMVLGRSGC